MSGWGSTDSNDKACLGLWFYPSNSSDGTKTTVRVDAWIWTKWAIHDSDNNYYWDHGPNVTSASKIVTKYDARDIYTTVSSGSSWSTDNQQKIDNTSYTYSRTHSNQYIYVGVWLDGVAGCGSFYCIDYFTIPKKASYTITYDANGGTGAPSSGTKWHGEAYTVSSTKPTKTGYDFVNWTITSTGATISAGGTITAGSNANYTLKANWTLKKWTVAYNANGGSSTPSSVYKYYNTTLKLASAIAYANNAYTFSGWNTNNSGTGTNYAAGGNYTANSGATLYAKWIHSITYNANGGSGAPATQTANKGTNIAVSSTAPTRSGYTFEGWHAGSASGTKYNAGTNVGTNLALVAKWLQNYAITYNPNGGSGAPSNQTKVQTINLTLSSVVPVWENHTFHGWQDSNDASIVYAPGDAYTANRAATLSAIWTEDYLKPTITNITAYRCDSNGDLDDEGTRAVIAFDWTVDTTIYADNVGDHVNIKYKQRGSSSDPTPLDDEGTSISGTSGSFSIITNPGIFNTEYTYDVEIELFDNGHGSAAANTFISLAYYIVDFKRGGHGIGFGGTADEDLMKVYMESKFIGDSNFQGAANFQGTAAGQGLLDFVYPVGSIYMSVNSTSPATLFGGTWQQLQNTFLLAAGSSYTAGSTGGAATVTLTTNNLPSHTHTYNKPPTSTGGHTLTVAQMPSHQHGVVKWKKGTTTTQQNVGWYSSDAGSGSKWQVLSGSDGNQQYDCGTVATGGGGSHSHTITSTSANTGEAGSGTAVDKMPPYLAVYMWKRTA